MLPVETMHEVRWKDQVNIDSEKLSEIVELSNMIPLSVYDEPASVDGVAIRRFHNALGKKAYSERLVDFVTVLEGLFLPDSSDKYQGELRYRFSLNGATYLSTDPGERKVICEKLKNIYDVRSSLVHKQQAFPDSRKIKECSEDAYEFARIGIKKALKDGWPSDKVFQDLLLG